MVTDGRGRLFVRDGNNSCIHIFRVADGRHIGVTLQNGEQSIWKPFRMRWDEENSTLKVIQRKTEYYMNVVKA